jgi:hypothetical protein
MNMQMMDTNMLRSQSINHSLHRANGTTKQIRMVG